MIDSDSVLIEHYSRLVKLRTMVSSFQNQYLIETALQRPDPMWPELLDRLIDENNELSSWETENL